MQKSEIHLQPITNRDFKLPEDGWIQIAPLGEFNHPSGITQVIDRDAIKAMVNRFEEEAKADNFPGLLLDFDHFSNDTKAPSEAAGWISALANRDDGTDTNPANGLWAKVRWSDVGETAVTKGRYRLASPVWNRQECEDLGDNKFRPQRLDRCALTNDPVLKGMVPLSNRAEGSADNADLEKRLADAETIIAGYKAKEAEEIKNRGTSSGGHKGHAARANALAAYHSKQAGVLRKSGHEELAKNHESLASGYKAKASGSSAAAHITGELAKLKK